VSRQSRASLAAVSRRKRREELEAEAIDAMRGWQTDQDMFDDAAAIYVGLNRTDTRAIDILERTGPMMAGELATAARLTSGAVTALVDRLEAVGLVRRTRDTIDRRRVMIEITPKVAEVMAPIFGPVAEEGYRQIKTYPDEDVEKMLAFFKMSREFLQHHTARVHAMIAERDRIRDETRDGKS
jgi:DNA-binding MarR family transcriptional regulator